MMKKTFFLLFNFLIITNLCFSQSANIPLDKDYLHWIDRYEIRQKSFSPYFFTSVKAFPRKKVALFADSLFKLEGIIRSQADRFNLFYLANDNWEFCRSDSNDSRKPLIKHFYKKTSDLYYVQTEDFDLHLNPVWHFSVGKDNNVVERVFINSRGLVGRGIVGNKVGFYFYVVENQARFPRFVQQRIDERGAIPSEGFWKREKNDLADFLTARGYIQVPLIRQINAQFGHDKNFIGNGYRSLILSDFAEDYTFLRLTTNVWKLQYTNLFAQMVASNQKVGDIYPKKFMALHHLSLNVTHNFNIGFFESVTFSRQDSIGANRFDVAYLNPIIFYRALEHDLGDPDNVILGMDFKWNFLRQFQFYGQVVIDELIVQEMLNRNQWWGNKQALQLGAKWIDVAGIPNLDLQGEINLVRPYTYTHFKNPHHANYQHYEQPLAHPLGANFRELVGIVRYQPLPRFQLIVKTLLGKKGEDSQRQENNGGDIFKDYTKGRPREYGVRIGQGTTANFTYIDITTSYQLRHNLFLEFKHILRRWDSIDDTRDANTQYTSFALRWNVSPRQFSF